MEYLSRLDYLEKIKILESDKQKLEEQLTEARDQMQKTLKKNVPKNPGLESENKKLEQELAEVRDQLQAKLTNARDLEKTIKKFTKSNSALEEKNQKLADQNELLAEKNKKFCDHKSMIVEKNKKLESHNEKLQEELKKVREKEASLREEKESIRIGKAKAEKRRLEIQAEAHNERIRLEDRVRQDIFSQDRLHAVNRAGHLQRVRQERVRQDDIQTMPDFDEDPVAFMRVSTIQGIKMMVSEKI